MAPDAEQDDAGLNAWLSDAEQIAQVVLAVANNPEVAESMVFRPRDQPQLPAFREVLRLASLGAEYSRRQGDNSKARIGRNRARNINMAAECIKRRRDPAYDGMNDSDLMAWVGSRQRKPLGRTQSIEAVKDGLTDPVNQSRIEQSGYRRRVDGRRSIFDGSKRIA